MGERVRTAITTMQSSGLLAAVALMVVFFSVANGRFFTASNIVAILVSISIIGMVAIPGAMLIVSGFVDFSVGSVAVLAGIVFGELAHHVPLLVAAAISLGIGLVWGVVAGFLVCRLQFSAIVVTLAGYAGLRGLAELISHGQTQFGFGAGFGELGNGKFVGVPVPVWMLIVLFGVGLYLWYLAPLGRHVTALGADPVAAHSLGIKTKAIPQTLYLASGLLSALGGLVLVSQLDASSLSIGLGLEIEVLTAVLLGGVAFTGGRGSLVGVLLGALFIGVLQNGLVVMNISPYITNVAVGAALMFAAGMDVLYLRLDRLASQKRDRAEAVARVAPPSAPPLRDSVTATSSEGSS